MEKAQIFAKKLLQINALKFNMFEPFVWASGWRAPVYCDNRKILSHPNLRDYVKIELANSVSKNFPNADTIAGVAIAGVPHGTLVADLLHLPFIHVRSRKKDHGLENRIEGELIKGQKVVVIEDLVSTGKSSLEAVEVLRDAGAEVTGMCALFTYGFPQTEAAFQKVGVTLFAISNYSTLIELAEDLKIINAEDKQRLSEWRINPDEWGR